jgi:sugar/nucleoside kinase (ribokinase family)
MIKFTSIGDCCIDVYPQFNQAFLGGSAFNLCLAAQKLKVKTSLISAVGTDNWGKKYFSTCINSQFISSLPGKTSHVIIRLDSNNSPVFSKWQLGVLKKLKLNTSHQKFLSTQTAVACTAIKPLKKILDQFCQMDLPGVFKSADFDGNTPYTFSNAALKKYAPAFDLIVASRPVAIKHQMVLITMGKRGSRVITPQKTYFQPAIKTKPTDTTGAGDAYLATFIIKYLQTKDIQQSMFLATQAAAQKITRLGASS